MDLESVFSKPPTKKSCASYLFEAGKSGIFFVLGSFLILLYTSVDTVHILRCGSGCSAPLFSAALLIGSILGDRKVREQRQKVVILSLLILKNVS